jgi:hypothetical protein
MAVQKVNVDRQQPYTNPAYDRPQRIPADNRRQREQNIKREDRRQPSTSRNTRPTTDQIFNDQYADAGVQPTSIADKPADRTSRAQTTYTTPSSVPKVSRTYQSSLPKIKRKKKVSVAKMALARVRVTTANAWIGSWAMFWYLTFQMPLAVMSAAGLGMAYAVYTSIVALPGGKFLLVAVEGFADVTGDRIKAILDWAGSLFGITFDPLLLFITPFALVFLLGLFQLIFTWFIYSLMRIKSLSGTAGGLKGLMFILAGVGYAIPILNLFPLIFIWMIVVWIHPK